MGLVNRALILISMLACLTSVVHAIAGQATFYPPPYVPSLCNGLHQGVMIVAANRGLFANKGACGKRYRVRCTGGTNTGVPRPCKGITIDVTVIDLCPECAGDQLDLSQEAFAMIANPDAWKIKIDYHEI